jgi:hypothetical protein
VVLLSQMIRSQAITGSTDASWFQPIAGRQGGRWAEQHVRAAFPQRGSAQRADTATRLENLSELREQGVISDAEFQTLRSRLGG